MTISLIKALKSPFEKYFLIPCIIWAVMVTWAYTYMQMTKDLSFMNNIGTHCLMLLPYTGGLIIMIGYFSSFAHRAVLGQKSLFSTSVRTLFANGIKTFLFTLSLYVILFSSEILAIGSLTYLPTGIGLFAFIFIQAFMFLYLLTAWTKFSDTLCMTEPLRLIGTSQLLGQNWPAYLKITLYMIIAILILAVPTGIIRFSVLSLAYTYPWISYLGIFIMSFLYLYPVFVVLHIMAQGYAGIKNTIQTPKTTQPNALTKPTKMATQTKRASKKAPAKTTAKTSSKASAKTASKTVAKKKTKSAKKEK